MTSSNALLLSHGYRVTSSDDRFLKLSDSVTDEFSLLGTPGRYFVDYLPACALLGIIDCIMKLITHLGSTLHSIVGPRHRMEEGCGEIQAACRRCGDRAFRICEARNGN